MSIFQAGQKQRHVGTHINGSRLAICYKQLPGDAQTALVIYTDTLPTVDRDEVLILLQSPEGQVEEDFATALYKKGNLFAYYHKKGFLKPVSIDEVVLTPEPNRPIPLRAVINAMNQSKGLPLLPEKGETVPTEAATTNVEPTVAEPISAVAPVVEDKKAVAAGLMFQAKMLQEEADKKLNEAYKLDASLKPKKRKAKRVTKAKPKVA